MTAEVCDKAIIIFGKTNDGCDLSSLDLKLVENAINGLLSDDGINKFIELYKKVDSGKYTIKTCYF